MAERVYQYEIAIVVFSTISLWYPVMHMQLLLIEECVSAFWTYPMLFPGNFLSTGGEVFDFCRVSLLPIVFKGRVIG